MAALGWGEMREESNTNVLLAQWQGGEGDARNALIARLHPELLKIAGARLRQECDSSLSTGDLINDAVLRIMRSGVVSPGGRANFVALASHIMRNILVDHARAKGSSKRRHRKVELHTQIDGGQRVDLMELEAALIRLRALSPELSDLVEMRYFGGMTTADVASVTGVSEPTVKRRWQVARAWLLDALAHPVGND